MITDGSEYFGGTVGTGQRNCRLPKNILDDELKTKNRTTAAARSLAGSRYASRLSGSNPILEGTVFPLPDDYSRKKVVSATAIVVTNTEDSTS
jgi:hypothetical protein